MDEIPSVIPHALVLAAAGFLPMLAVLATSFTKISIVLMMLRSAMGVQQSPSAMVINSISISLTLFILVPVFQGIWDQNQETIRNAASFDNTVKLYAIITDELQTYMQRFATERDIVFYIDAAKKIWPEEYHVYAVRDNFFITLLAHITSELTRAFEISVIIFIPFLVIDMVVSNILLAMGAMMVSPVMISLPIKILFFVSVDGWSRILHSLLMSYA